MKREIWRGFMPLGLASEDKIKERLDSVDFDAYFSPQFAGINRNVDDETNK